MEAFELMLTGGHPNSLGRTIEVVNIILANPAELEQLYQCYFSSDEVVRLRVSNAMKRVWREHPTWLVPYIDRFISEIALIHQPSAQWTIAQLFLELDEYLSASQRQQAIAILQKNLQTFDDWIVTINTFQTLGKWAKSDAELADWLLPHILRLQDDPRKSVAGNASKVHKMVYMSKPPKRKG
jgi:hypothetical protein